MMRIIGEHRIEFITDDGIEIPVVFNSIYVYKVGDVIKFYSPSEDEEVKEPILKVYEVTEVFNELFDNIVGEQSIVVKLINVDEYHKEK